MMDHLFVYMFNGLKSAMRYALTMSLQLHVRHLHVPLVWPAQICLRIHESLFKQ